MTFASTLSLFSSRSRDDQLHTLQSLDTERGMSSGQETASTHISIHPSPHQSTLLHHFHHSHSHPLLIVPSTDHGQSFHSTLSTLQLSHPSSLSQLSPHPPQINLPTALNPLRCTRRGLCPINRQVLHQTPSTPRRRIYYELHGSINALHKLVLSLFLYLISKSSLPFHLYA